MKKEEGDVFKQFQDSFSKLEGHFHILEQRIPVDVQMEYFQNSEKMRDEISNVPITDDESEVLHQQLLAEDATADERKKRLTLLAISKSIKAYRLLEDYVQHPEPEVADWAYMALMESRISLESELSDEKQIYISTGLGGRDGKLRFYVLLLATKNIPFEEYQRQVIDREFNFFLLQKGYEIERLTIAEGYVEMLFLVPVKADIRTTLNQVINECNQYGDFLSKAFTITNVKELTQEEIEELIKQNGDGKASN